MCKSLITLKSPLARLERGIKGEEMLKFPIRIVRKVTRLDRNVLIMKDIDVTRREMAAVLKSEFPDKFHLKHQSAHHM